MIAIFVPTKIVISLECKWGVLATIMVVPCLSIAGAVLVSVVFASLAVVAIIGVVVLPLGICRRWWVIVTVSAVFVAVFVVIFVLFLLLFVDFFSLLVLQFL